MIWSVHLELFPLVLFTETAATTLSFLLAIATSASTYGGAGNDSVNIRQVLPILLSMRVELVLTHSKLVVLSTAPQFMETIRSATEGGADSISIAVTFTASGSYIYGNFR